MKLHIATGAGVAERWRKQYERSPGVWGSTVTGPAEDVYAKLLALGPTPTPEAVASVIGNKGWSFVRCRGCDQDVRLVVEYGDDDDKFTLCRICLMAGAAAALEAVAAWQDET